MAPKTTKKTDDAPTKKPALDWLGMLKRARQTSTPLVAITTPDVDACAALCAKTLANDAPKIRWDCASGLSHMNDAGEAALAKITGGDFAPSDICSPEAMLKMMTRMPAKGILFAHNLDLFFGNAVVMQALHNLRDLYKTTKRMIIVLGASISLPEQLRHDVLSLEEPLPDDERLGVIADEIAAAIDTTVDVETRPSLIAATRGLAEYDTEQVLSLALQEQGGFDLDMLWQQKRTVFNTTPGLTLEWGGLTFDQIGGLRAIIEYLSALQHGPRPVRAFVFIDEIEKATAGASGDMQDTSGTSQDIHQLLLSSFSDFGWRGILALGHPGTGKSFIATCAGATFNVPTIRFDLNALKGGIVGQSEQQGRAAMRAIHAIAGDGAFFIATCNKTQSLSPELQDRFGMKFFFDLPSDEEKAAIVPLHMKRTGLVEQPLPDMHGWSSRNIRDLCDRAHELGLPLLDAAKYVVPALLADPQGISRRREQATGRFLSASYHGPYKGERDETQIEAIATGRRRALN